MKSFILKFKDENFFAKIKSRAVLEDKSLQKLFMEFIEESMAVELVGVSK